MKESLQPPIDPTKEKIGCDKTDHLKRSIAHQPNHLKSKKVKEILSQEEFDETKEWFELEGKTDTLHLGS